MLDQVEQNGQRLLISDLVGHVDRRAFKVLRHAYLTDTLCDRVAFGRQLTPSKPIVEGGTHWIAECNLHGAIPFLEGARNFNLGCHPCLFSGLVAHGPSIDTLILRFKFIAFRPTS
jgi:hypothetical protein